MVPLTKFICPPGKLCKLKVTRNAGNVPGSDLLLIEGSATEWKLKRKFYVSPNRVIFKGKPDYMTSLFSSLPLLSRRHWQILTRCHRSVRYCFVVLSLGKKCPLVDFLLTILKQEQRRDKNYILRSFHFKKTRAKTIASLI